MKMKKLYLEDLTEGTRLESSWYTVSHDEIVRFAEEWDPYDFHLEEEAAKDSIFGGLAACAAHIFAINSRLSHELPGRFALVAGLGGEGIDLLAPVRPGDRLRLVRRITRARESKTKPDTGVVTMEDTLESPSGEAFFRTAGSILVERRSAS